ncbi:phospholipase D-like domain-containing protein [Acinetobacter gerneri]|jgi:phosphatidylserine/phosphatidylglycerophosphate/cardiolipin synthase-like enzyme|uniref:phospholipase D-like domain-containing protein n=1 Tax=Acinetobacter gerneri TaxID=202952 RepID=UPI0023F28E3C|nr:phospholipase D-like domain-containing protein [Acinetobacter gerneri]MCH4243024.1 phospholipase D-like domain-containing protein [Acinetobacter gerneri]
MANNTAVKNSDLKATYNPSWFLKGIPVRASHFEYMINGQRAFLRVHEEIEKATKSIDIAIWGFQPSMFFKRDGKSLCIGDLLAKKALEGVKVRVLIWSMPIAFGFRLQTMKIDSTNMGNNKYSSFKGVEGVTSTQQDYDRAWYFATGLDKYPKGTDLSPGMEDTQYNLIYKLKKYPLLERLYGDGHQSNITVLTRSVVLQSNKYNDINLKLKTKGVLKFFPSHHQKTVLIDYEVPQIARGFVLEHNMLDNYWDTDQHPIATKPAPVPMKGRNAPVPLQDTSSFLRGPILFDINANFVQSWGRESADGLRAKREKITANMFPAVKPVVAIQALRTYDQPDLEQIKQLYLQNIKKTTSYIYTENQYFRWPPLVEEFKKHWQNMKKSGQRVEPIHWFIVTNSSDAGLGDGTVNTDRMFAALGRRDVMPEVAKIQIGNVDIPIEANKIKADMIAKKQKLVLSDFTKKIGDIKKDLMVLKKDLSAQIGIKCHICVLHSMDSKPGNWQEIYVHSKVTIIDDVFLTMGSANINTRSMQTDTEMNIAIEHGETARKLRHDLWALNVRNINPNANLTNLFKNADSGKAFQAWQDLINENANRKNKKIPQQPLTEFLRLSSKVSNLD